MFFKEFPWNQPSFLWAEPVYPPPALTFCGLWLSSEVWVQCKSQCHLRQGQHFRLWLTPCSAWTSGAGEAEGCSDLSGHTCTQLSRKNRDSIHQDTVSFIKEGNPSWPLDDLEIDGPQRSATFDPRIFGDCPETDLLLGGWDFECKFPMLENTSYTAKIEILESIHCSSLCNVDTAVFFFLFAFSILKTHTP